LGQFLILYPFGNPQPRGFFPLNHFHDPFGLFEKRIRADLIGISITLSFGNPQPGGFNPLYPFHDPFGLSEERIRADSFLDILSLILRNRGVSTLCIFSMTLSGCSRKGIGRILVLILRKTPTGRFQPFVSFP
jgi:hypothetical protein